MKYHVELHMMEVLSSLEDAQKKMDTIKKRVKHPEGLEEVSDIIKSGVDWLNSAINHLEERPQ